MNNLSMAIEAAQEEHDRATVAYEATKGRKFQTYAEFQSAERAADVALKAASMQVHFARIRAGRAFRGQA